MSKTFENAIAKVRRLLENLQDMAAERLMGYGDEPTADLGMVASDRIKRCKLGIFP
jgi:hypothetical protein